jgi:hypothetical protein
MNRNHKRILFALAACILYVLSFGPVARLVDMRNMDDQETTKSQYVFLVLYSPLIFTAVGFRPFGDMLKRYEYLWEPGSN